MFTRLDPGDGNCEMEEMEVLDAQVQEQGNLNFLFEIKHNEAMERNKD